MMPSYPLQINIFSYPGILLDRKLSWSPHISRTTSKAIRTLNFLKRNLSNCSTEVKGFYGPPHNAVCSSSSLGSPLCRDIQALEKVQRRAARWAVYCRDIYIRANTKDRCHYAHSIIIKSVSCTTVVVHNRDRPFFF